MGIAPGLLLLVPPLQIYFGLTPVNSGVSLGTWLLYYAGFYFMQVVVALYTIGSFRWETLMLATASFPIYGQALVNAILNKDQKWHVTGSRGRRPSPFNFIFPQLMAFVFLLLTSVVGIWQAQVTGSFNLALVWNVLNTVVLGIFLAITYREARTARATRRRPRRGGPAWRSARASAPAPASAHVRPVHPPRWRPPMTFLTRLKYLIGVLVVVAAVAALALSMNNRISTVHDVSATVRTDDYTVGTPYAGMVVKRTVDVGDHVDEGDRLFVVQSSELARDIANDALKPEKSPYDIRGGSKVVIRATSAGKVAEVAPIEGAFVAANSSMATVQEQGTSYVQADFRLTPEAVRADAWCRRGHGPAARRADGARPRSTASACTPTATVPPRACARCRRRLNNRGLFASGTPVNVDVALRRDGLVESVRAALAGLLTPGGLR